MFLHNRSPAGSVLTSEKQISFFLFCTCTNKHILVCPKLANLNYNNTLNRSHTSSFFPQPVFPSLLPFPCPTCTAGSKKNTYFWQVNGADIRAKLEGERGMHKSFVILTKWDLVTSGTLERHLNSWPWPPAFLTAYKGTHGTKNTTCFWKWLLQWYLLIDVKAVWYIRCH